MTPIDISSCNKAEYLIASLILANVESQQDYIGSAKKLLNDALNTARQLKKHGAVYRARNVSKFACFTYEIKGERETFLLPIINKNLIIPAINLEAMIKRINPAIPKVVQLIDVSIVYFRLQLQTEKLITALSEAMSITANNELIEAISNILDDSLPNQYRVSDFLGMAEDYFTLARNMLVNRNSTLTLIALRNADKALQAYGETESVGTQSQRIQNLKMELKTISEAI